MLIEFVKRDLNEIIQRYVLQVANKCHYIIHKSVLVDGRIDLIDLKTVFEIY